LHPLQARAELERRKRIAAGELHPPDAYPDDPKGFVENVAGLTLWGKLEELIHSVQHNRYTIVETGHAVGKSLTAAALVGWWMSSGEAKVLTLAPTWHQVASILWSYIRKIARKGNLPGHVFETPRWDVPESPEWFARGLSPRKATQEDVTTLQGYHHPRLLVVLDEAPGLPRILWDAVRGLVTSEGNRILALGNPLSQQGPFWDSCVSPNWHHIHISCLEHPNVLSGQEQIPGAVSKEWVDEMVRDHATACLPGEPGAFEWPANSGHWYMPDAVFQSRVLGRAPEEGVDQLISLAWVDTAQKWTTVGEGEVVIGLDPARHGGNYAAMVARRGSRVMWVKRRKPMTNDPGGEVAGWLKEEMDKLGATWAFVDDTGIGSSVVDTARRVLDASSVRGVTASSRAQRARRFNNTRTECWWRMREALQQGRLSLPHDEMLAGDLTAPKYSFDNLGRYLLEKKEAIIKRIGRSPDSGDALALTFALSVTQRLEAGAAAELQQEGGSRWHMGQKAGGSRWRRG
jgi:hypothetical protein